MLPVKTLFEDALHDTEAVLPPGLRELYDGDLDFPPAPPHRPYVFGNFVSTLDGIVSYRIAGHAGGAAISGSDPADRFIMGLLRASADAVMVGAGTVHDVDPNHLWIPGFIFPEAKDLYQQYRVRVLGKSELPLVVIVSGSGSLDLGRAIFQTPGVPVLIITSAAGRTQLANAGISQYTSVQVRALENTKNVVDSKAILRLLFSEFKVRTVLHEGGPTLFGHFLAGRFVDELFITLAPQIAGRLSPTLRPGMVEGVEFLPTTAPWLHLVSGKMSADQLYLRYRT